MDGFSLEGADATLSLEDRFDPKREETAHRYHVHLLHEIFGNPFQPILSNREGLTSAATNLALAAYECRCLPSGVLDTARLLVVADALEEIGTIDWDILVHLRGSAPHVRGCWALDLLLRTPPQ
jgi:hypothetical protein